jgi:TolB-like protein/tetratricopeptide (TPR) repeat protein
MIGRTLGHYRIVAELGAGGMGHVYRAHDERLDRDGAVKVLPAGAVADDQARRQLRREAQALAKISHPNIGVVHDFDTADGVDFMVMELVPGGTLDRKIAAGPLPERDLLAVGLSMAAALTEAHELGIVHCDLKPSNVAITPKDQVKILDFGLARLVHPAGERDVTRSAPDMSVVAGTLPYMAPEQLLGQPVDARTDLYALGVVLYEMATGQRPFVGATPATLTDAILHAAPASPLSLQPGLSPELERIILKCLEKDPGDRYQSAKEIGIDLRRTGSVTATVPLPLPPRRRRRGGVTAIAVAAGLLAAGVAIYGLWPRPALNSVAVLPFVNATGDSALEFVGDGLAEELINGLTQVPGLKVIARPTAFAYRDRQDAPATIGRALNVRAIVMGRVTQQAGQVTVQVDLVDVGAGAELWGGQFRRPRSGIQEIGGDIVRQVAASLRLKLTGDQETRLVKRPAQNAEAYLLYLRGRSCLNSVEMARFSECARMFQQALDRDPAYVQALAGLADTYAYYAILYIEPPRESMGRAREAAVKALQLDDTVAEAHTSLGIVKLLYDYDFAGAEAELRRAVELSPGDVYARHWYAHYLEAVGRMEDANAAIRSISELDPLTSIYVGDLAMEYYLLGQYDKVVAMSATWTSPKDADIYGWISLALCLERLGRREESLRAADTLVTTHDSDLSRAYAAAIYARLGRKADAGKILAGLEAKAAGGYVSSFLLSLPHAALGNTEAAIQNLVRAFDERSADIPLTLAYDPQFDSVRGDQRLIELSRRFKLPEIRQPR